MTPASCFQSGGQHFEQVTIRVAEIKPAPAMATVDRHVLRRTGAAAVGETLGLDPVEDAVEFGFADLEGIMVAFELVPVVEIDGQLVVDLDRREMRHRAAVFEPEDAGEKPGGT